MHVGFTLSQQGIQEVSDRIRTAVDHRSLKLRFNHAAPFNPKEPIGIRNMSSSSIILRLCERLAVRIEYVGCTKLKINNIDKSLITCLFPANIYKLLN